MKLIGEINPESYILATLQLVSVMVCPSLRAKVNNAFVQHIIVQIEPIDQVCKLCSIASICIREATEKRRPHHA